MRTRLFHLPAGRRSVIHPKAAVVTQLNPSVATRMGGYIRDAITILPDRAKRSSLLVEGNEHKELRASVERSPSNVPHPSWVLFSSLHPLTMKASGSKPVARMRAKSVIPSES